MNIASGSRFTARSPLETKIGPAEAKERSMANRTRSVVKHMVSRLSVLCAIECDRRSR